MPKKTDHLKPHQFKKGEPSPNPKGRPPMSAAQKALKNLTVETYREVVELVLTGNLRELKAMAENPETSAVQVGIAVSFMKAIKSGDYVIIEKIAERIIGKIPEYLNVKSDSNVNIEAKISVIDREMLKRANEELEKDV